MESALASDSRFDVAVVGAGPAGASCALATARQGLGTVLVDRLEPPRYKTCGGGLVGRALQHIDTDIESTIERRCKIVELRLADAGLEYSVERNEAPVAMVMRSRFDARLVEAAREAGASFLAPCGVRGLEQNKNGVRLSTDRGPLEARVVVAADGAGSRVARAAGWEPPPARVPAIESEVGVAGPVLERFGSAARFDFGLIPGGYAWVFPKRDHLSIGCLSTKKLNVSLNEWLERYLDTLGLGELESREDHGFAILARPRRRVSRGRVLLAGDAAGLADPVTFEGISNAIQSGRLAARALFEEGLRPQAVARRYRDLLDRSLLRELRWARRMAPLLYGSARVRNFLFRRLGVPVCEAMTDVFCGARTYRSLVRGPRRYLRAAALVAGLESRS